MLATVDFSCGRHYLTVAGIVLAMEGDRCRDGDMPNEVYEPISAEEMVRASIGGKPIGSMPLDVVRFFRPECWNKAMLEYAAKKINDSRSSLCSEQAVTS